MGNNIDMGYVKYQHI